MNFAGKLLTFLILIMSLVFLVLAVVTGASHQEWKEIAKANKTKAETARRLLDEAKQDTNRGLQQLKAEATSRQQQLAQLNTELAKERQNRQAKEQELLKQLEIATARLETLKQAEERLVSQDQEIAQKIELNKNLVDEVAKRRVEVTTLTNDLFELKGRLDEYESRIADTTEQLAKAMKVLKANGLNENMLVAAIEPRVEGVVLKSEGDVIVLSLGTDDGLRVGHVVDIFRGDRFVAKAVLSNPEYNMSAARVMPEYRQALVKEGDVVSTKL